MAISDDTETIFVLDSDCIIKPECLNTLCSYLEDHEECGIVGAKVYWADSPKTVQELGAFLDWEGANIKRNYGDYDESAIELTGEYDVDYVPACCLAARRSAIDACGNVDPRFFLYFDDVEWAYRFRRHGYAIRAITDAQAMHYSGGKNKRNHVSTYYFWRNRIHFFRDHAMDWARGAIVTKLAEEVGSAVACHRLLGRNQLAGIVERAAIDAANGLMGKMDLDPEWIKLDPPMESPPDDASISLVNHAILGSNQVERSNVNWVIDTYGLALPVERACGIRDEFISLKKEIFSYIRHKLSTTLESL
jgi:hypothetical protein